MLPLEGAPAIAEKAQRWYNGTNCVKPWEVMSMSNDKIAEVGVNIQEKATVIWNIANALFGRSEERRVGKECRL